MSWLQNRWLLEAARGVAGMAVNWWIQSALLIAAGLVVGSLCRRRGSAVQSAVYRTTLAAVIAAPLATWGLSQAGVAGWSVEMPAASSMVAAGAAATASAAASAPEAASVPAAEAFVAVGLDDAAASKESTASWASPPIDPIPNSNQLSALNSPALASPSSVAPVSAAPLPPDATPVFTIHRFGAFAVAASLVWLIVATVLLARLAVAWRRLANIRRGAAPAEGTTQAVCRELASRLRVTPPAVLRSPFLPSPCLAGLRRPAVLLPEAAGDVPMREVLAHELAHLSRGDCLWNLLRQLTTSLLFFQPLAWRLSRRLEASAEEVCDDYVVHLGGDRRGYAHRLVDIAELSQAAFAPAGVGMVSLRSMLGQRVARILDTSRSLSTRVGGALLALVLIAGVMGTLAAGLVGLSATAAAEKSAGDAVQSGDELAARDANDAAKASADDDVVTVVGQVVDPGGKPVPNVDVHVLRWYWNFGDKKPLATAKTDARGKFEISYRKSQFAETAGRPNQWRETYIAAFVDGFGPGWAHFDRLKPGEEAIVKLVVDGVPIEGRIVDLEGNPIAGAKIEVGSIAEPKSDTLDEYVAAIKTGQAISTAFEKIDEMLPQHSVGHWPNDLVTDSEGRFRVTGIGNERLVDLHVSGPSIVTKTARVATRRMDPIVHPAYAYKDADDATQYGAKFEYAAAPSRAIEGIVRDATTGKPLAGAEIWSWKFAGENISGITSVKTKADEQGRYRLEGMPKGAGNRIIVVPTDLPYFTAEFDVSNPPGSDPVSLDVELHRGVWVVGRVTDKVTGKGISAHMIYLAFPDNKLASELSEFEYGRHHMSVQDRFPTDAEGNYRIVALPGHGIIAAKAVLQPYPGGQGYRDIEGVEDRDSFTKLNGVFAPTEKFPTALKEIRIEENSVETVCNLELDPGDTVKLHAVDPAGAPLSGVHVTGVSEIDGNFEPMTSADFDLLCFRPGENRTVLLYHPERRLGKALRVKPEDGGNGPLVVGLEPYAVVTGTLLKDGVPVAGASLRVDVAGDNDYGRELRRVATDADGRFLHDEFLPGLSYNIIVEGAGIEFATIAKELEARAGETVDLGTIDIAVEERPAPMRSGAMKAKEVTSSDVPKAKTQIEGAAAIEGAPEETQFSGSVVTPDGRPAADADLYLVFHIPQPTGLLSPTWKPMGRTDAKGAFNVTVSPLKFGPGVRREEMRAAALVAVKEGFGFAWGQALFSETSGEWIKTARARLAETPPEFVPELEKMLAQAGQPLRLTVDDQPLRGRIVNVEGQGVPAARVTLLEVWTGVGDDLSGWREAAKQDKADYYSVRTKTTMAMNGPQVRSLVRQAVTGADGQFTLRGVGRGRIAELLIEGPGVESARIFARTEVGESIVLPRERRAPELGNYTYHPAEFTHVAGPSTAVVGVVRDAATKKLLAGVTVKSQSRHGEQINGWRQDFVRAVTDEQGHYELWGLPIGDGNRIAAIAPADGPYFSTSRGAVTRAAGDPLEVNLEIPRGVWIEGRVVDKQTGRGLSGEVEYYAARSNPQYDLVRSLNVDERDRLQADDEGRFRIVGLPGPGFVSFQAYAHQDYPRATTILGVDGKPKSAPAMMETGPSVLAMSNVHAVAEVNPSTDSAPYPLNLELEGGKVVGHVVDAEGKAVSGFQYSGRIAAFDSWESGRGDTFELVGHDGKTPRQVVFAHMERNLAGVLTVSDASPEKLIARLQPAGAVRGRLIDSNGAPLSEVSLMPWSPPLASPSAVDRAETLRSPPLPPNVSHSQDGEYQTDADGRFEIAGLAPGVEYRLRAFDRESMMPERGRAPKISGPLAKVILVEPGQSLDLGDVTLADEAAFTREAAKGANSEKQPAGQVSEESATQRRTPLEEQEKAVGQRVHGVVKGADGKPAEGADIAIVALSAAVQRGGDLKPYGAVLGETKTDAAGAYELVLRGTSSKTHRFAAVVARAEGAALGWAQLDLDAADVDASFSLTAETPLKLKLVDIDGQPAAGAKLRVGGLMKRSLLSFLSMNNAGVGLHDCPNPPAAWIPLMVADEQGTIVIPNVADNYGIMLKTVGDERFAPQDIAINTGMAEQRGERDATYRAQVINGVSAAGTAAIPLAPAQLFTGTVTFEDTGEPAPRARLTVWASQQEYGSMISVGAEADAEGRYQVGPNPGIRFGVTAYPPDGAPYLIRTMPPVNWKGGERSREVNIKLPRGVLVRGKILDAAADKPVAGATVQYEPESANNPRATDDIVTGWQAIQKTDDEGRFEITVLPGPGRLLVHGPAGEFVLRETSGQELYRGKPGGRRHYASWIERIEPAVDGEPLELTMRIERGATVRGELVDASGAAVPQAVMVTRLNVHPTSPYWRGQPVDVVGGRFEATGLSPGQEYALHFLDARRQLGATVRVRAGMAPPRVVLQPCGKATMRLVDADGKPVADHQQNIQFVVTPGVHEFSEMAREAGTLAADADFIANVDRLNHSMPDTSDADGRLELKALIPGATYRVVSHRDGKFGVERDFMAEADKTVDLGDIVVERRD